MVAVEFAAAVASAAAETAATVEKVDWASAVVEYRDPAAAGVE